MPRILGITIPENKKAIISLTYIYGIGRSLSGEILSKANVSPDKRAKDLTAEEVSRIQEVIEKNCKVEGDLRREIGGNIKRLKDIGSYRGSRHSRRLPVRGQRTKTNSRTVRGNIRHNVGSGRRKTELK